MDSRGPVNRSRCPFSSSLKADDLRESSSLFSENGVAIAVGTPQFTRAAADAHDCGRSRSDGQGTACRLPRTGHFQSASTRGQGAWRRLSPWRVSVTVFQQLRQPFSVVLTVRRAEANHPLGKSLCDGSCARDRIRTSKESHL